MAVAQGTAPDACVCQVTLCSAWVLLIPPDPAVAGLFHGAADRLEGGRSHVIIAKGKKARWVDAKFDRLVDSFSPSHSPSLFPFRFPISSSLLLPSIHMSYVIVFVYVSLPLFPRLCPSGVVAKHGNQATDRSMFELITGPLISSCNDFAR